MGFAGYLPLYYKGEAKISIPVFDTSFEFESGPSFGWIVYNNTEGLTDRKPLALSDFDGITGEFSHSSSGVSSYYPTPTTENALHTSGAKQFFFIIVTEIAGVTVDPRLSIVSSEELRSSIASIPDVYNQPELDTLYDRLFLMRFVNYGGIIRPGLLAADNSVAMVPMETEPYFTSDSIPGDVELLDAPIIPDGQTETTPIDPTSLLMGCRVGQMIRGMRKQQKEDV